MKLSSLFVVQTLCAVAFSWNCALAQDLPSTTPLSKFWSADSNVDSIEFSSDRRTLYLGGAFRYMQSDESGGFVLNTSDAAPHVDLPAIQGDVYASISDGLGGRYLGGNFTFVGSEQRSGLAHLRADNSIDLQFAPQVDVGTVHALLLRGNTLYIGGDFTSINGETRNRLASLDKISGALSDWAPNVSGTQAAVYALGMYEPNNTLYVGGKFTAIDGTLRRGIAAFHAQNGSLQSWAPTLGPSYEPGVVRALAIDAKRATVFAGGYFRAVNDVQTSFHLAGLRMSDGQALSWSAGITGNAGRAVETLALDSNRNLLFLGGYFTAVGGQSRSRIAAVDATSGQVTSWNPNITGNGSSFFVSSLVLDQARQMIFTGGRFSLVNGQSRYHLAEINAETGAATEWNASFGLSNQTVYSLEFDSTRQQMYVGGNRLRIKKRRNCLAAIDVSSGQVTDWNPDLREKLEDDPNDPDMAWVKKIALHNDGNKIYAAARGVRYAGGQDLGYQNLLAIDVTSGAPDLWSPQISAPYGVASGVTTLLVDDQNNALYVGGTFASASGQSRRNLVRYRLSDHLLSDWDPRVGRIPSMSGSDGVSALQLDRETNTLYVGGHFSFVGDLARKRLAAIDTNTAVALPWRPDIRHLLDSPSGGLYGVTIGALLLQPETNSLYLGFSGNLYIANHLRTGFAALSTVNDQYVSTANPLTQFTATCFTSAIVPDRETNQLHLGGRFMRPNESPGQTLLTVDLGSGLLSPWAPITTRDSTGNHVVESLQIDPSEGVLYVGGMFGSIGQLPKSNFAALRLRMPEYSCPADFDASGQVTQEDLFAFLSAWFARNMSADIDGSGSVAVPDIFAFLTVWFGGC